MSPTSPQPTPRPRDNPLRHFVIAFAIALVLYAVSFGWIQHRRTRKGPWQIAFTNQSGSPAIVVNQPWLHLTNVTLLFPQQKMPDPGSQLPLDFRDPHPTPFEAGFASCIFEDLTFLPGTVTLKAFNHEIELLPRVLVIDKKEMPWESNRRISLGHD